MTVWEETIARRLRALHLDTIRNKILVFAVLATLLPTLVSTCVSYGQTRRLLEDRVAQELRGASSEAAREVHLWLTERLSDLRVSASSYVIPENLARLPGRESAQALARLRDYLNSVRDRSPDLEALLVLDERGRVVTTSTGRAGGVRVPPDRINALRTGDAYVGDAFWDTGLTKAVIALAVPIRQADGRLLGAFTGKVSLDAVVDILQRLAPEQRRDVYLITEQGRLVVRGRGSSAELMRARLPDAVLSTLLDREGQARP